MTLKLHLSQHNDGEGFTIHSEGKDIWEAMPESELRRLEPVLTSAAELHYWTSEVEQAETIQAVKDVACRFMRTKRLACRGNSVSGSGLLSIRKKLSLHRPLPSLICRRKRPKPKRKSRQNMLGTNRRCRRKLGNICASSLLFTTIQSTGGAPCRFRQDLCAKLFAGSG